MQRTLPPALRRDIAALVQSARAERGIINISELAERLRLRHERENIALEDIAELVLQQAQQFGTAIEFDSPVLRQ